MFENEPKLKTNGIVTEILPLHTRHMYLSKRMGLDFGNYPKLSQNPNTQKITKPKTKPKSKYLKITYLK